MGDRELERAGTPGTLSVEAHAALLALVDGPPVEAHAALLALVDGPPVEAHAALLALVDKHVDDEQCHDDDGDGDDGPAGVPVPA